MKPLHLLHLSRLSTKLAHCRSCAQGQKIGNRYGSFRSLVSSSSKNSIRDNVDTYIKMPSPREGDVNQSTEIHENTRGHTPVLVSEVLDTLNPQNGQVSQYESD